MQRVISFLAISVLALVASSERGNAEITYPWCAQYSGGGEGGGGRNCGFWSYEQCRATVSGIGGSCEMNAMYRGPQPRRIEPIRRSACPFCHGERADVG